ncbi:hypothetical protein Goklo_007389, partial [Gossypium klotzschianum]|nr:hypothetical protein [Gossypium klotzschianum]
MNRVEVKFLTDEETSALKQSSKEGIEALVIMFENQGHEFENMGHAKANKPFQLPLCLNNWVEISGR